MLRSVGSKGTNVSEKCIPFSARSQLILILCYIEGVPYDRVSEMRLVSNHLYYFLFLVGLLGCQWLSKYVTMVFFELNY